MSYYELTKRSRNELGVFLSVARIIGDDAEKLVEVASILEDTKNFPYIEIKKELVDFILKALKEVTIEGKYAALLVQTKLLFSRPLENIPEKPKALNAGKLLVEGAGKPQKSKQSVISK